MFDLGAQVDAGGEPADSATAEREDSLLVYLMIWEGNHRTLIYGVIALALWIAAWAYYLRNDVRLYLLRRKSHRWGVDMAAKTVTSGPKPVQ
jgi:hypothetical protein